MPLSEITADELGRMDRGRLAALGLESLRPSRTRRSGYAPTDEREPGEKRETGASVGEDDTEKYLPVRTLRQQYVDYLTTKVDEIEEAKEARRYYHGAQLTADQLRVLRGRGQPPQVWNFVSRKLNSIIGLVERMRSDPKALPRTPKSEQGAEIATQSIRYVLDSNEWKSIEYWCLLQCSIDGIAGTQRVLKRDKQGKYNLRIDWVIGDEYFYQPKSYRLDFADSRYEGIAKWVDLDEAIDLFPDKEELISGLFEGDSDMTTNPDRDIKWLATSQKRLRLVEHWYKHKGRWCWAFYVSTVLLDEGESPFFDDEGNSISSFDMFAAAVDQDGDRYGFVRNLKPIQDALNGGKSKMLHLANTKTVKATKGVVDDVETARTQVARADGYIEMNPGGTFDILDTKQDLATFASFTEDAKNWINGFANTNIAESAGVNGMLNMSGRAIELLRQPGMAELGPMLVLGCRSWKLRVYRNIWNTVQRYWTEERWIPISGNDDLAKFIQLNGLGLDAFGRPAIINAVGALDVGIILEEGQDVGSLMQETYELVKGDPTVPWQVKLEMSSLPRSEKNRITQLTAPKPPPPDPAAEIMKKLALENAAAEVALKGATVRKTNAGAEQALATADEKRAKAAHEGLRAGQTATTTDIAAAEFARDTLVQAHELANPPQQGEKGQPKPQGDAPPIPGARRGRDAQGRSGWFVTHPTGQHFQVA